MSNRTKIVLCAIAGIGITTVIYFSLNISNWQRREGYKEGWCKAWEAADSVYERWKENDRESRILEGPIIIDTSYVVIQDCIIYVPEGAGAAIFLKGGIKDVSIIRNSFVKLNIVKPDSLAREIIMRDNLKIFPPPR